jgi:hypothetical protein
MLIVTEECGTKGTLPTHVYKALQDPALGAFFADPVSYRQAIEALLQRRIKIYRAGELYPYTSYTLINNDNPNAGEDINEMDLEPSGVWPIPSPPELLTLSPESRGIAQFRIDAEEAATAFRGSVFPAGGVTGITHAEIRASGHLEVTQERLFDMLPGIYYNFLCRALVDEESHLRNLLSTHFPAVYSRVEKRLGYNTIGTIGDLLGELDGGNVGAAAAAAATEIRATVAAVMARRSASRSSSEKKRATTQQAWQRLMRALSTTGIIAKGAFADLVAAVPAEQINQSEGRDGRTALADAAAHGHLEAVEALLARGADIEAVDYEGRRPLLFASNMSPAIVHALLSAGANPRIVDIHGMTPLHFAAEKNSMVDAIPELVAVGIDPNTPDTDGDRPLHFAARENASRTIRALLDAGADPNAANAEGFVPLILAVSEEKLNSVAALVRAAAIDMTVKHPDGRSSLAVALRLRNDAIAMELVTHGYNVKNWDDVARAARSAKMDDLHAFAISKVRSSS